MNNPKQSDIDKAEQYLRERIDAELLMQSAVESLMKSAAKEIVEICYYYYQDPLNFSFSRNKVMLKKIKVVVDKLEQRLKELLTELAVGEYEKNQNVIIPWIMRKRHGLTLDERLNQYMSRWLTELEILIGAGMLLRLSKKLLAQSIGRNLKRPYDNPDLKEAIGSTPSYGQGRTNSMYNAIRNLTRFGVAEGRMKNWYEEGRKKGVDGYVVRRGSSYPCDICDSMTGFHRADDTDGLPPYHLNCCCIAIYD